MLRPARPHDPAGPRGGPRPEGPPLQALRALYEQAVRRQPFVSPAHRVVRVPPVVRLVGPGPHALDNGVTWARLDETDADEVIAREVAWFAREGRDLQWDVYDTDGPHDLVARLERAGFEPGAMERLMGAHAADVAALAPPTHVRLVRVEDAEALDRHLAVGTAVGGPDLEDVLRTAFRRELDGDGATTLFTALVEGEAVGAAHVVVPPGSRLGHLFGANVLTTHRRHGVYRALLAARGARALAQGATVLVTDANGHSGPILERLGFRPFGTRQEMVRRRR